MTINKGTNQKLARRLLKVSLSLSMGQSSCTALAEQIHKDPLNLAKGASPTGCSLFHVALGT
jgi:hypothetical protein